MRKMAEIVKIDNVEIHPNADLLDICTVKGWKCVTKRDEFKSGDLAIYCAIDSWIPHTLAPFLSKGQYPRVYDGVEGERLKTVRLRGALSQGLILPTSVANLDYEWLIGDDIACQLGIVKYEPPVAACLAGISKGAFPSIIPKTDEERIQNLTNEWPVLNGYFYEVTEKLEGSSMTVAMKDGEFIVCSRNLNLKEVEGNTLWDIARRYDLENKMRARDLDGLAIQGEVIGEGIQNNHYGIKGQDFYVFSMYSVKHGGYLSPSERRHLCETLGLKHVPLVDEDSVTFQGMTIDEVLAQADGQSRLNPKVLQEGFVCKRIDGQEHWKAVSNKYLLKHG